MKPEKQLVTMNGSSVYFTSQYLFKGEYMFRINAPFNTQMLVSPENPIPGLKFVDQNPEPNIFNAILTVPQDGQYGFKITLDKPVSQGQLEVLFVPGVIGEAPLCLRLIPDQRSLRLNGISFIPLSITQTTTLALRSKTASI